jgi:hypothetical protein
MEQEVECSHIGGETDQTPILSSCYDYPHKCSFGYIIIFHIIERRSNGQHPKFLPLANGRVAGLHAAAHPPGLGEACPLIAEAAAVLVAGGDPQHLRALPQTQVLPPPHPLRIPTLPETIPHLRLPHLRPALPPRYPLPHADTINAFEVMSILILTAFTTYSYKVQCTPPPTQSCSTSSTSNQPKPSSFPISSSCSNP